MTTSLLDKLTFQTVGIEFDSSPKAAGNRSMKMINQQMQNLSQISYPF